MTYIFYAQTDMTGDMVKYFKTCGEAKDWVEAHADTAGHVWRIEVDASDKSAVVDLLNGHFNSEPEWEFTP